MDKFCVITGDLKGSRKLRNREKVQEKLKKGLEKINTEYKEVLLAKFMFTRGDEFQGVLKSPSRVFSLLQYLKNFLKEFYIGMGIGEISTKISEVPGEMDGEAFYNSREALQEAKKMEVPLRVKTGDNLSDQTINTILNLINIIKEKWSKRQKEIIHYYRNNEELTYSQVGKKFKVSKQSISQTLKAANWKEVKAAEEVVQNLFQNL